jgi:proteasome lid subunit RPN8/RPN11
VRIRRSALDALVAHALRDRPNECCGLLIARDGVIEEAFPARNVHERPTRFLIDPHDHFAALRHARASGGEVAGAYHSHPTGPPTPSATDRAEMNDPSLLYVVVSLAAEVPEIRAFSWEDGNFIPAAYVPLA